MTTEAVSPSTIAPKGELLHILSLGMGIESVAILLRWLIEPGSKDFELDRLIVLVAQTGDEYRSTGRLIETQLLPLLRQHQIRLVQVARGGRYERQGYTVLDDSDNPQAVYVEGGYALSQELLSSGTIPRLGRPHYCAMKYKGYPLDSWISQHVEGEYIHYLGYNTDEEKRSSKSDGYTKHSECLKYPLQEWGWSREDCDRYILEKLGVQWLKSCCKFCPFQQRELVRQRWLLEPEAGGFAAYVEAIALAFNPRMHLFSFGSAYDLLVESGNQVALDEYNQKLAGSGWAVYRVQRIYRRLSTKTGRQQINADRNIAAVVSGNRDTMLKQLKELADQYAQEIVNEGPPRFYLLKRLEKVYPALEDYFVLSPHVVPDKCCNPKSFGLKWAQILEPQLQLPLEI